jgi:hypothetical protein
MALFKWPDIIDGKDRYFPEVAKKILAGKPIKLGIEGKGKSDKITPQRGVEWPKEVVFDITAFKALYRSYPKGKSSILTAAKSTTKDYFIVAKGHDFEGNAYPWNTIFKGDFSTGGSGGGAAATKIVESLQCYYSSLLYNSNLTELTLKNISFDPKENNSIYSTEQYCDTTVSLQECLKKDPWGAAVYIKIANALYESDAGKEFKGSKKVYFHRGSKFMDAVYARKKRCLDHDKRLAKDRGINPVAPAAFSNDKWNPGDIWMTTQTDNTPFPHHLNEGELGEHTCDWGSLKDVVRESAEKGITLGVSLKKVDSRATVLEYNTKERSQNLNPVWGGFTFGRRGDFFSSADMYVTFSRIDIQFRSTATTTSWQGEIKGGAASGGKIGGGGVQYYVEKYFGKTTTIGLNAIAGHGWKETSSISVDRAWILYKKFNELQNKHTETLDKETFKTNWKAADAGLRFSKGMNLEFLDVMYNRGTTLRSGPKMARFAKDIFRYAASNTDYSSFFVKIS